jgi:hypothetical protein
MEGMLGVLQGMPQKMVQSVGFSDYGHEEIPWFGIHKVEDYLTPRSKSTKEVIDETSVIAGRFMGIRVYPVMGLHEVVVDARRVNRFRQFWCHETGHYHTVNGTSGIRLGYINDQRAHSKEAYLLPDRRALNVEGVGEISSIRVGF